MENCPQIQSKTSKNGKFTSNYKASPIDVETQISFRRLSPLQKETPEKGPLKTISPWAYFRNFTVYDSEQQSINSQGHSENYAQSDCSEIDGFAECSFEVLFVPYTAVENLMSAPSTSSFSVITVACYRRKIWLLYLFLAIYKAGAVWLSLRSMLGRARGTSVFDISSFGPSPPPPPHKKKRMASARQSMIGYDEGTYARTFMRVSTHRMNLPGTDQGRGR